MKRKDINLTKNSKKRPTSSTSQNKNKLILLILLIVVFVISVYFLNNFQTNDQNLGDLFLSTKKQEARPSQTTYVKEFAFETVFRGSTSISDNRHQIIINDVDTWETAWRDILKKGDYNIPYPTAYPIDFVDHSLVVIFSSSEIYTKNSSDIKYIKDLGNKVQINVESNFLGEHCLRLMTFSVPYEIVKTSKITKPVEFIRNSKFIKCNKNGGIDRNK